MTIFIHTRSLILFRYGFGLIHAMELVLDIVHEIVGTGTLFPNENGEPVLHMHVACGRNEGTVTGCVRRGVKTWHILE